MRTTQTLAREHVAIASILERFERRLDEAERNSEIDREAFERLLGFFEQAVDGQHQEKEERILLPCLVRRAADQDAPDVQRLFREHLEDRKLLAVLRDNLESASYGEPNSIQVLVRYGRLYLLRERKHARWEETALFPLAARILTPEDDREILQGFRHLDALWDSSLLAAARRLSAWIDQRGAAVHPA